MEICSLWDSSPGRREFQKRTSKRTNVDLIYQSNIKKMFEILKKKTQRDSSTSENTQDQNYFFDMKQNTFINKMTGLNSLTPVQSNK